MRLGRGRGYRRGTWPGICRGTRAVNGHSVSVNRGRRDLDTSSF